MWIDVGPFGNIRKLSIAAPITLVRRCNRWYPIIMQPMHIFDRLCRNTSILIFCNAAKVPPVLVWLNSKIHVHASYHRSEWASKEKEGETRLWLYPSWTVDVFGVPLWLFRRRRSRQIDDDSSLLRVESWEEFNHDSSEPLFATWVQCFSTAGCRAPRHSDSRDIYWLYSKYAWPWSIPLRALFLSKIPPISNFLATSEHIASHPAIITKLNENKT